MTSNNPGRHGLSGRLRLLRSRSLELDGGARGQVGRLPTHDDHRQEDRRTARACPRRRRWRCSRLTGWRGRREGRRQENQVHKADARRARRSGSQVAGLPRRRRSEPATSSVCSLATTTRSSSRSSAARRIPGTRRATSSLPSRTSRSTASRPKFGRRKNLAAWEGGPRSVRRGSSAMELGHVRAGDDNGVRPRRGAGSRRRSAASRRGRTRFIRPWPRSRSAWISRPTRRIAVMAEASTSSPTATSLSTSCTVHGHHPRRRCRSYCWAGVPTLIDASSAAA
jgi:hypothetical protein